MTVSCCDHHRCRDRHHQHALHQHALHHGHRHHNEGLGNQNLDSVEFKRE